ncbi:MAG: hypothetical protein ACKVJ7_05005 [Candidatus Poseidoniales archaeon]|jgi:hypothetical protein
MAGDGATGIKLETWLMVGFVITLLLSTSVIVITSFDKSTVFSAYVQDSSDDNIQLQQISLMRADLGDGTDGDGYGYDIANTMSTPMLVNDWREPHRTTLVITAPEKPFDAAEADAIHDFVTNKGGKVLLASNSTNAQLVANKFGVNYMGPSVADDQRFYEVEIAGERVSEDIRKTYAIASVKQDLSTMDSSQTRTPCSQGDVDVDKIDNCFMPVLFHRPTAIQVLNNGSDGDSSNRVVKVLAHASPAAYLADGVFDPNIKGNPIPGDLATGYIVRIDYPGIEVVDKVQGSREGEVIVTGSIVFVSDHSALANHLWDRDTADLTGKQQCTSDLYSTYGHNCWGAGSGGLSAAGGDTQWLGNSLYFSALLRDMMEVDNDQLSSTVARYNNQFYIVFDESRHVTSAISAPFTEAMGAIVMLTSDTLLKWLIILNLMALLSIAIMVVPEKENWRHVFDLTRFRERPNKVDPSLYLTRVRESLMSKVRQFKDLTRDEMVRKTPAEIQMMISDPRLIELLYSQQRSYSNEELRELLQQIRRWGKYKTQ